MDCTASRGPVARETLAKHGRPRSGMAEGTQVLGKAGRTRLPVGVTGRSCPSAGVGPRTAARQAQPALPRPCRPPLIGAIFQRYFPRSQQRFDNKQKGGKKGFNCCEPHPERSPGLWAGHGAQARLRQGRNGGQQSENDAGSRARCWQSQEALPGTSWNDSMPFTFNASDVSAPQPPCEPFAFSRGCGRPPALRARQNRTGGVQNSASLPHSSHKHRQSLG